MSHIWKSFRAWFQRFAGLFGKPQGDAEFDAELESHLQLHIEDNLQRGMTPDAARREALLKLGGIEQTKEDYRHQRGLPLFESFLRDLRFAFRILRKSPGFTAVAVLTLAIGIGANTAIFSVVYASLLSPLPYPNPDQLVMVWSKVNGHRNVASAGDYLVWKKQNTVFQDLVAWTSGTFSLSIDGHPEAALARVTTPGFFKLQGIPLALGRDFQPGEGIVGNEHCMIMTHVLWQSRFGSDPNIIGQEIRLNGELYKVVGVLSPGMPDRFESHVFVPLAFKPEQLNHDFHWLAVMGRLKPDVTIEQANADMNAVTRRIAEVYPLSNKGWGASVERLQNAFTSRDTIKDLWLLMGAVGFVLLIACMNVANLLLARGTTRQKEAAVRTSLGATPGQVLRQFMTESLALAFIGGGLGIALASTMLRVILVILPPYSIPTEADVHVSVSVLVFTLAATALSGVLCGCAPAWQSSRWNLSDALKEGGRTPSQAGRHGLRRSLVIMEFALALTLLSGAGLLIRSFWKLTRVDLGFRRDHLLTFYLPVRPERFANSDQIAAFYRELLPKIAALPGISSVSASTGMPIVGTNRGMPFSIAGQPVGDPSSRPSARLATVTPSYFQTFGIQIVKGRSFTEQDVAESLPVAIVNETFVKKYLPNVDPLRESVVGEQLIPGATRLGPTIERQIVGVYRDVHNQGIRGEGFPEINVPFWQSPWPNASIAVRTAGDPASATNSAAAVVQSMDSDLPLDRVRTMDQVVDESLAGDRFATALLAAFAFIALILAGIGIYGVMSFSVAQQTQEIGLRMALGATSSQVLIQVLREGMLLALTGLVLGLGGTYFVGRTMQSVLYEVTAIDPLAVGCVAGLLLLAAVLACYMPAQRATRVDPMTALRCE
ncbi:MAG TPA: ABC transporter permease [Candidatus Acidoferrum sp.]|nr:ABC transporter permease [Candidatus Acidoferrum sp.]